MNYKILVLSVFIGLIPILLHAQVITSVPPTVANDRYFDEIFSQMKRPGLSVIGFDNGGNHSKGYGLKQILNQVYVTGSNEQKSLFKEILDYAREDLITNPTSADQVKANSNVLQYLAFEALASYILEENGISHTTSQQTYGIPIRQHSTVLSSFKNKFMVLVTANKLTSPGSDYVKNTSTYANIARAIDLYLALENAYTKWNGHTGNTSLLLSQSQKQALMSRFVSDIKNPSENYIHDQHPLGINEDETEPGNRPLKGYMTIGYATLAAQKYGAWQNIQGYLNYARVRV